MKQKTNRRRSEFASGNEEVDEEVAFIFPGLGGVDLVHRLHLLSSPPSQRGVVHPIVHYHYVVVVVVVSEGVIEGVVEGRGGGGGDEGVVEGVVQRNLFSIFSLFSSFEF